MKMCGQFFHLRYMNERVYFLNADVQQRTLNSPATMLTVVFALCQNDSFVKKKDLF